jgi:oligopeptidase B
VDVAPPVAAKHPHAVTSPHGTRDDPYFWLRDDTRQDPAVLAYLQAENAYAAKMLAPAAPLEAQLIREMTARVDENESTVPVLEDGYWYWTRYEAGKQRPIYMRRKDGGREEEVLLDANQLATGHSFYAVGDYAVTRDGKLLAWTDDSVGRNQFELHIKNLDTGALFTDGEHAIAPAVEWANDNKTLFMVGKDPTTLREDRVLRHPLGGTTELVYQEADAAYYVDIHHLKSRKYIAITLDETTTSETRLIDAYSPAEPPIVFRTRKEEVRYEIEDLGNRFVMRTNDRAPNYKLIEVRSGVEAVLAPERPDVVLEGFAAYRSFIAVQIRRAGLSGIEVVDGGVTREITPDEVPSTMSLIDTPDIDAKSVRYAYESLVTPPTTYELGETKRVLKRDNVPTYDASKYKTEYRHAGKVPISIVYRKDTKLDGTAPLLVFGYGAYGDTLDPTFDRSPVSLLDRGWVYAIAHVRGGEELGRPWYDDGRLLAKKHTFEDFIAVTEYLIANKYGNRAFAEGASAGGLLMGAIANMRPDLYRGIVAWVPFVDVVTTMLDASIPLVTNEYDEWGDPADKAAYDYMLSYSPYDNVGPHPYPALYVRSGLWDSQVQYYEPAKWVARLRATKRDDHLLVFETDMHAGHEGSSGRFEAIREYARAYAFMLFVDAGATARRPGRTTTNHQ